ncbi:MAG: YceI family protein [Flaviaesturariibacter sp.]|nr:YceI family protein [Flaviaesturariibacter sp.]
MIKQLLLATSFLCVTLFANAQGKYFTKTGKITFTSNATLEDIEAKNKSVVSMLDTKTGALQFSVLMKSFEFEKALMQEHFNATYIESNKYPKAEFRGTITNNAAINYTKPGTYTAKVKGLLTIHGVTKPVQTIGTIKVDGDGLKAMSSFDVKLADYKIAIGSGVKDKIAKTVKIDVETKLEPLK